MDCPNCGTKTRTGSSYCHECGTSLHHERVNKGHTIVKWILVITALNTIPGIIVIFRAVLPSGPPSTVELINTVHVAILLVISILLYRGHRWAKFVIGLIFILSGFVTIISTVLSLSLTEASILCAVPFSFLYVIFGVYVLRSKEIDIYVEHQSKKISPEL